MLFKNKIALILVVMLIFHAFAAEITLAAIDGTEGSEYDNIDLSAQFTEAPVLKANEADAGYSDIFDEKLANIVLLLSKTNIMSGISLTEFAPYAVITRGEFLKSVLAAIKVDPSVYEGLLRGEFYDLKKDDAMYSVVAASVLNNLARGFDNNAFGVDKPIAFADATQILVHALGYEAIAQARGGSLQDYFLLAREKGLLAGLNPSTNAELTRSEAARLIYNSITAPVFLVTGYVNGQATANFNKNETILTQYHNIYFGTGIVESNTFTAITESAVNKRGLRINGEQYSTRYGAYNSMLGYKVDYYYHQGKNSHDAEIVCMWINGSVKEVIIDNDDYIGYENGTITYSAKNSTARAKIDPLYTLVYNGSSLEAKSLKEFLGHKDGNIILVSNDGDGVFENVFVNNYSNVLSSAVVQNDDGTGLKFNLKYNYSTIDIVFDTWTTLEIEREGGRKVRYVAEVEDNFDDNGRPVTAIDLSNVPSDSVISFFASDYVLQRDRLLPDPSSQYIRAVISNKKIKGKVEEFDIGNGTVTISGANLKISKSNFFNEAGGSFSVGDMGTFYLDAFDRITAFVRDVTTVDMTYGYLISIASDSPLSNEAKAKILTYDTDVEIFTLKDSVKLNGTSITTLKLITELSKSAASLRPGFKISQMIRYAATQDNTIVMIETATPTQDQESFSRDVPAESFRSTDNYSGYLLRRYPERTDVSNSADYFRPIKYFTVPDVETFDDEHYYTDRNPLFTDKTLTLELYDVSQGLTPTIALEYSSDASSNEVRVITSQTRASNVMVKRKYLQTDKDGFPVSAIQAITGYGETTYVGADVNTFADCEIGEMIILWTKNPRTNIISRVEHILYDGKRIKPTSLGDPNVLRMGSSVLNGFGEVWYVDNNNMIVQAGAVIDSASGRRETQFILRYNTTLTWQWGGTAVYDGSNPNNPIVKVGTVNDIKSVYRDGHGKGSLVYWQAEQGNGRQIVVYNGCE